MLGTRGVLDLLGVRETAGSVEMIPPGRMSLLIAFEKLHRSVSIYNEVISCVHNMCLNKWFMHERVTVPLVYDPHNSSKGFHLNIVCVLIFIIVLVCLLS